MKPAEIADNWRRLAERDLSRSLVSVRVAGHGFLHSGLHDFGGPIDVICGRNSSGKTTLLRSIAASLGAIGLDSAYLGDGLPSLEPGQFWPETDSTKDDVPPAYFVDASAVSQTSRRYWQDQGNVAELLEQYEFAEIRSRELQWASFVLGRDYSSVQRAEISDFEGTDLPLPYFMVERDGRTYSTMELGAGELSFLTLQWALSRLEGSSIVFLEEPETHLAPFSHERLCDWLAIPALSGHHLIVTTHSSSIVEREAIGRLMMAVSIRGRTQIRSQSDRSTALLHIGHRGSNTAIVGVEDDVAKALLRELLAWRDPALLGRCIVSVVRGGDSVLARFSKSFPLDALLPGYVSVVDGGAAAEERDRQDEQKNDSGWPVLRLPGNLEPETQFRAWSVENLGLLSESLGREAPVVEEAVERLEGLNDHEWLSGLAESLGLSRGQIVPPVARQVLGALPNDELDRFLVDLRRALLLIPDNE